MNTLTLVPIGGLGQRLCAMASAVELAAGGLCNVRIAWPLTPYCRERFSEIFLPVDSSEIHNILQSKDAGSSTASENSSPTPQVSPSAEDDATGRVLFCEAGFCDMPSRRSNLWLPTLTRTGRFKFQTSYFRPQDTARLTHALIQGNAYVASGYQLTKYSPLLIRSLFHPKQFILDAADQLASTFTPKTIGVIIRRIDVRSEIQTIPLSVFTNVLDRILETDSSHTFFLSSDDHRVRRSLTQRYGSRIILREGKNMYDAAVDMWAMSHTGMILGSYRSAFAQVASELSGTPLQTIGPE